MITFQCNYLLVTLFIRKKINRMCGSALGGLCFQDGQATPRVGGLRNEQSPEPICMGKTVKVLGDFKKNPQLLLQLNF